MTHRIRTIDAHVGGQSLRLLVEGAPGPMGRTIFQKGNWLRRHADHIRKAVLLEPRGHRDLVGAQLTAPGSPGAHAGVIFMGASGYLALSGHGVIAVATIAIERQLFFGRDSVAGHVTLVFETGAGPIQARCLVDESRGAVRVASVAFTSVPAFVQAAGQPVRIGGRELRVDVARAGLLYAIADTEAVGIPLVPDRLADLRRAAGEIVRAFDSPLHTDPPASRVALDGVVFTGPPQGNDSHLRAVTVKAGGAVDRSPGGTGMSALMSVLDAMELLPRDRPFVQEGLVGSTFSGRVVARTAVDGLPAISTEIEGSAWITGEHTFLVEDDDPFREGFVL